MARYDLLFVVAERGLYGDYDYGSRGAAEVRAAVAGACQVILGIDAVPGDLSGLGQNGCQCLLGGTRPGSSRSGSSATACSAAGT